METQASKVMEEARAGLVSSHPSLGYLSFKLNWFPDPTCETAWTDGVSVGFNPAYVLSLTKGRRKFLVAHEIAHPMLGHHLRRGDRNERKWNRACDYVVNLILVDEALDVIEKALFDYKFRNMAAEEVYEILPLEDRDQGGQIDGSGASDDQGGSKEGSDDQSGSGGDSGGQKGDTAENPDPGMCGEVRDFPGASGKVTEEESSVEEERWSIAIQQAAQITRKLEGKLPGFVETILTNIKNPKLPWTEILSRWLTSKAKDDYTFTKPNLRYSGSGFFMPALESQTLGKVAVFWDTSGSVTDDQASDIASETLGILSMFPGLEVDLYHIDSRVRHIEKLDQYTDWGNISAKGRGGTDFRPGFYELEDSQEEPPVGVIYMTDGECSQFPEMPAFPVLWVIVDMPQNKRFNPPFGEVTYYDEY